MSTQSCTRFPAAITLLLAAGFMFAAVEAEPPPSEKPGWEWKSPHVSKPIKSERSHAAREVYEDVLTEAWQRLAADRRGATGEYRAVLESARSGAMQADDLQAAVKLDDAIKSLDGDGRQRRMEELTRRVGNTRYGQWYFFPDGYYGVVPEGQNDTSRSRFPWEVIDVNTVMAGSPPAYLWIVRFADDMGSAAINGRNDLRDFHFVWQRRKVSGRKSQLNSDATFASAEVLLARRGYDDALQEAQQRFRARILEALPTYRETLEAARKSAMRSEDLDESVAIDVAIKRLGDPGRGRLETHALAMALSDTTWRATDDAGWRFDFHADGKYSTNRSDRGTWAAIDENTVVAGSHPFLWVITFDDVRRRGRLRGPHGGRRLDLWMVRVDTTE